MEGTRIRLSRFTEPGDWVADISSGRKVPPGTLPEAHGYIVFPGQVPSIFMEVHQPGKLFLIARLTTWDGERLRRLGKPASVPFWGGEACLVDLVVGFGDGIEVDSLEALAQARGGASSLGLPVLARIILNPEPYLNNLAENLNVPLTIAEELGADAILLPPLERDVLEGMRKPQVPFLLAVEEGLYQVASI